MIAWILKLVAGKSVIWCLIGAATLAVGGYVTATQVVLHNRQAALDDAEATGRKLAAEKAVLQRQVDDVTALNTENLAELGRIRAANAQAMADVSAELKRARKAGQRLNVIRMEIARDPDARAPLATACPAADRYLERLRRDAAGGAAAPDRDQDRAGGGDAPGRAPGMPGRAAGTAGGSQRRG